MTKPELVRRNAMFAYFGGLMAWALLTPGPALAYVGPGLGLGAIASFFSLVGAVLFGILGFAWYPLKRLIRRFRTKTSDDEPT